MNETVKNLKNEFSILQTCAVVLQAMELDKIQHETDLNTLEIEHDSSYQSNQKTSIKNTG